LQIDLLLDNGEKISNSKDILINNGKHVNYIELNNLRDIKLWSTDSPNLYEVTISLFENSKLIDSYTVKTGFRTIKFTNKGFYLNNKPLKIMGLNRHQSYPYVGYAMPKRIQEKDADILKYDLGLNTVRTSHYPQSKHFLNRCDEIGLLVFEEVPGWQHIGDEQWKEITYKNVEEMITRDWNHPSIILWGVRINESKDDHDFYIKTNEIAHALDTTRPTGGVRARENSEFLEDVFTMNDFIYGRNGCTRIARTQQETTGLNKNVPYLITEYGGHMYPTKRFDQEERVDQHAKIHISMINDVALDPSKSGAIGWCAFDYNTHHQFGSGDHICYHGVMDMFRMPKFAAYAYKSQINPKDEIIMEPITYYTRGDRSGGGIAPLMIFTNCDRIDFHINGIKKGEYFPAYTKYPGVPHPPIIIEQLNGMWGSDFNDGIFKGYINDKKVIERIYTSNPVLTDLKVKTDNLTLNSGDWDATRITLEAVDQMGNITTFCDGVIKVTIDGPISIIGPDTFPLIGGARAFWIRTNGISGKANVKVELLGITEKELEINIK